MEQAIQSVQSFFKRKDVVISAHRYGIDAMGAMAQGLFASLLIGTIIKTLGQQLGLAFLVTAGGYAAAVAGPAMAASIGYALHAPQLVLFSLIAVGGAANELGGAGGPLAVYLIAIIAAEVGKLVSKETKIDILVTPAVTILVGVGLSALFAPSIGAVASAVGSLIMWATELQPLLMGIVVSVLVGMALTLPISSAAICAALGLTGLAGGAAVAGCCAQMVGFAVMSYKENGVGGLVSQGLGTSMLQMPNILRNPRTGFPRRWPRHRSPIAACLFHLRMNGPAIPPARAPAVWSARSAFTGWIESGKAVTVTDWIQSGADLLCPARRAGARSSAMFCEEGVDQRRGFEALSTKASPRGKLSPKVTDEGVAFPRLPVNGLQRKAASSGLTTFPQGRLFFFYTNPLPCLLGISSGTRPAHGRA